MPLRQKFDFTTDYSNARPAERPRPFGGSKEDRAKRMSKAGKKIALGDQPNLWQTAARSDFVEYPAGTLASKAGPVDTSTSNMELTWEAPEGSDPYPLWETTMGSFAEKTRNASIEQEPANKPPTNNVNWKFGDEKRTWETAFKKDFPCHDPKLLKNPYENRPRGPKLATLNFGDDPNPGQYTNTYGADYVFDPAEVEKNRVEIAKPNRSSKLRFGDVQRTWETATRCDFIERPAEKFTKAAAAVDVKKSTVVIGEGKDEWITSYSVEIGAEQKGELAKKVPLKPLVTTVQIGDGVTALFQTAAKADYVDFSSQSSHLCSLVNVYARLHAYSASQCGHHSLCVAVTVVSSNGFPRMSIMYKMPPPLSVSQPSLSEPASGQAQHDRRTHTTQTQVNHESMCSSCTLYLV